MKMSETDLMCQMFAEAIRRLSEKTNIDLKKFVLKDEKNSHDPNECVLANF